ncbi:MAG: ABC transporter [Alphaproteobacteria bacterium]|nr:ABC transporter [Alphaproteobacteria bacterium]
MPGLVPGIHACRLILWLEIMDGRVKPGHDG